MDIVLACSDQGPMCTLESSDDCEHVRVVVRDMSEKAASQVFARYRLGQIVGGRLAWVNISALRRLARESADLAWYVRVEKAVDCAERQGRLSTQRAHICCPCEWEPGVLKAAEMVRRRASRGAAQALGVAGV